MQLTGMSDLQRFKHKDHLTSLEFETFIEETPTENMIWISKCLEFKIQNF